MADLKSLIEQINIVDLISEFSPLTKAGSSYKTLCNVHGDRSPSLSINPRKQIYKCFVCDHGGNALDYLIWAQNFSFADAVKHLANLAGEDLAQYWQNQPSKPLYNEKQLDLINCLNDATKLFSYYLDLYKKEQHLAIFLQKRHLSYEDIIKYQIGYAPKIEVDNYLLALDKKNHSVATLINSSIINETNSKPVFSNRIIFPILDENENIIGLSGRILDDQQPKYLHSKESLIFKKNQIMFNYHRAKKYDDLIIVEGFMDVIAFSKINQDNAIALMGLNLSDWQIQKLKKHKKIFLSLDQDQAGINATINMIETLMKNQIFGYVLVIKEAKDADELVNSLDGINKLKQVYQNPISFINFIYNYFLNTHNFNDIEQLKTLISKLKRFTQYLDQLTLSAFLVKFANDTKLDLDLLKKEFYHKNLVKLDDYNSNSLKRDDAYSTKKDLKEPKQELVNINKLLLLLFQNPSWLQFNYAKEINWFSSKYVKFYKEIERFHNSGEPLSPETNDHLQKLQKKYHNSSAIPRTESELRELIDRIAQDDGSAHFNQVSTQLISSSDASEKEKIDALEAKQEEISKKIK